MNGAEQKEVKWREYENPRGDDDSMVRDQIHNERSQAVQWKCLPAPATFHILSASTQQSRNAHTGKV